MKPTGHGQPPDHRHITDMHLTAAGLVNKPDATRHWAQRAHEQDRCEKRQPKLNNVVCHDSPVNQIERLTA